MTSLSFLTDPRFLLGVAIIVAVLRANRDDLPALFRALMGRGHEDDGRQTPPALPKPNDDDDLTPPSRPKP